MNTLTQHPLPKTPADMGISEEKMLAFRALDPANRAKYIISLIAKGATLNIIAVIFGVSHQRIKQLQDKLHTQGVLPQTARQVRNDMKHQYALEIEAHPPQLKPYPMLTPELIKYNAKAQRKHGLYAMYIALMNGRNGEEFMEALMQDSKGYEEQVSK